MKCPRHFLFIVWIALMGFQVSAQPQYRIIELNPTNITADVKGVNDAGVVIGALPPVPFAATLWDDYLQPEDLSPFLSGHESLGYDVNNHGAVVGYGGNAGAFFIKDSVATHFIEAKKAWGINNLDQWVGETASLSYALFWDPNDGFSQLNIPQPVLGMDARAVNDHGLVVGIGYFSGPGPVPLRKASIWENQNNGWNQELLPIPAGFDGSSALDVNNYGVIAGRCEVWMGWIYYDWHACIWQKILGQWKAKIIVPQTMNDSSVAFSINNRNQVVGFSTSAGGQRAFLWDAGTLYLLDDLVDYLGDFAYLKEAYGISDSGYIVCSAVKSNGANRAVVLKPVLGEDLCD